MPHLRSVTRLVVTVVATGVVGGTALLGCSSDDGGTPAGTAPVSTGGGSSAAPGPVEPSPPEPSPAEPSAAEPVTSTADPTPPASEGTTSTTGPSVDPTTTLAPGPEPTGAPGIDDTDAFCAAWARVVGIQQVLTIAANFGGLDPVAFARLEVLAAPTVVSSMATLEATYPADPTLAADRDTWFTRVLGPVAGRAGRATDLLREVGAGDETLAALDAAWLDTLRQRDPTRPVPALTPLSTEVEDLVDAAATAFDAQVTPWLDDPALVVDDALTPAVTGYVRATCPDLSALGIGDDI